MRKVDGLGEDFGGRKHHCIICVNNATEFSMFESKNGISCGQGSC